MTREEAIKELSYIADDMPSMECADWIEAISMGIKLEQEQEPCTDAISRQAVLNLAKFDGRDGLGSIIHAFDVEQLPPVTPAEKVGQWIPVSEKLPEESDYVSCLPFYDGVVIWLTDKGIMGFGWYYNCTNNWADIDDIWSDKYGEVIAWMPLPEPYKQEAEDEN